MRHKINTTTLLDTLAKNRLNTPFPTQQKSYFEDFTGAQERVRAVRQGQKTPNPEQTKKKSYSKTQNQPSKINLKKIFLKKVKRVEQIQMQE